MKTENYHIRLPCRHEEIKSLDIRLRIKHKSSSKLLVLSPKTKSKVSMKQLVRQNQ